MKVFIKLIENPLLLTLLCSGLMLYVKHMTLKLSINSPTHAIKTWHCMVQPLLCFIIFGIFGGSMMVFLPVAAIELEQKIPGTTQALIMSICWFIACVVGTILAIKQNIRQFKSELFLASNTYVGGKDILTNMLNQYVLLEPFHLNLLTEQRTNLPSHTVLFVTNNPKKVDRGIQVEGSLTNLQGDTINVQFSGVFPEGTTFKKCTKKHRQLV